MQDTAAIARTLATLESLGLDRVDAGPPDVAVTRLDRRTARAESVVAAMGTRVSVIALGDAPARLEAAVGGALEEMERLIAVFSRYDPASAITHLNDAGRLDLAPPELRAVVARARWFHGISAGAFDVTVAPLVDLFRRRAGGPSPGDAEIAEARDRVGAARVLLSRRGVRFDREGVAITLDGIAKGFIVDAMADALGRHGVTRYLINAGGDIRAGGAKQRRRPWTVAVQDPSGRGAFPDVIHLADGAIATSGGYERRYAEDGRFHHIVNGRTGRSPLQHASVSVLAPTAAAADALATALFVLEAAAGLALIGRLHGCACLIVGADGRLARSRRWPGAAPTADGTPP